MQLILGSQSPRRAEILSYFNLPFFQVSPPFDEESVPFLGDPEAYALEISKGKARALIPQFEKAMLLTADTIVYCEGKVYGKPRNDEEADHFLSALQGKWHTVFTGVTVAFEGKEISMAEKTKILLNPLTATQIRSYHQAFPCHDKAGAFQIQGGAGLIIHKIEGCYYNVVGLPINALSALLKIAGIDLWNHLA